jgi:hypothetical protein
VRKGEKGTTVVYADRFIPNGERARAEETGEEPEAIPFLKRFTVVNTDQCEDLPAEASAAAPPPPPENLILPQAEALIQRTSVDSPIPRSPAISRCVRPLVCARRTASSSNSFVNRRCCIFEFLCTHRELSTFPTKVHSSAAARRRRPRVPAQRHARFF